MIDINARLENGCLINGDVILAGDLVRQPTEAIVNPANVDLLHGGGAARAIASAAGPELEDECRHYIRQHGPLKVAQPVHTTAGNLPLPIVCVIHMPGPDLRDYHDKDECYQLLKQAFRNCFKHANNVVNVHSLAVPAISSGKHRLPVLYILLVIVAPPKYIEIQCQCLSAWRC